MNDDDGEENEIIIVPSIWSVIKDLFTDYSIVRNLSRFFTLGCLTFGRYKLEEITIYAKHYGF